MKNRDLKTATIIVQNLTCRQMKINFFSPALGDLKDTPTFPPKKKAFLIKAESNSELMS